MAPACVYVGPFKRWLEKLTIMRVLTFLSPSIWGDADGPGYVRSLLHGTSWGRCLVDTFWDKLCSDLIDQTHFAKHPETSKLIPDQPSFCYGVNLSILNYPTDILDFVRSGQVKVIRKDIECL